MENTEKLEQDGSLTLEAYTEKYKPQIQHALDLINTHSDVPEDIDQHEVISTLIMVGNELTNTLSNRVPEIVALQKENEKQKQQIQKLQEMNQKFYLERGKYRDPSQDPDKPADPPKMSFDEIKRKWGLG